MFGLLDIPNFQFLGWFSAMAQVSISKALMLVLVIVVSSVAAMVSAQDTQLAPAPAPTMDVGAAFSLPVSVAVLGSSVLFTLLALLKLWIFWTNLKLFGCKEIEYFEILIWSYVYGVSRKLRFDCIHLILSSFITYIILCDELSVMYVMSLLLQKFMFLVHCLC